MQIPSNLSDCLVLNTVAASRALLRRYDAQFKPFGVTVQQFALLVAIELHPQESVAQLAKHILLDRTSLTRNLNLLERKQLVCRSNTAVGNVRFCELTEQGRALLPQLLPLWQAAQDHLVGGLSAQDAATYVRIAKHLAH